jgi:hypothetical protein
VKKGCGSLGYTTSLPYTGHILVQAVLAFISATVMRHKLENRGRNRENEEEKEETDGERKEKERRKIEEERLFCAQV